MVDTESINFKMVIEWWKIAKRNGENNRHSRRRQHRRQEQQHKFTRTKLHLNAGRFMATSLAKTLLTTVLYRQ